MPIKVQCKCGKALAVPDAAAGKSVKCPGCQASVSVPAGNGANAKTPANKPVPPATPKKSVIAKPATAIPAASFPANDLSDLFDQEGFVAKTGPTCPACHAPIKTGATLCTDCGLNFQTGERVSTAVAAVPQAKGGGGGHGHGHGGADGAQALAHAREMMLRDERLQEKLTRGGGLPWWALLMILLSIIGTGIVGAITMIGVFAEDPTKLGAMANIAMMNKMLLMGNVFLVVFTITGNLASWILIFGGFKKSIGEGAMCMFIPFYMLYFAIKNWRDYSGIFMMLTISLIGIITSVVFMVVGIAASA